MPGWTPIPLGLKSYRPRSGTQSIERLVNLYAKPSEPGAKTGATLYGSPGLLLWATIGDGPCRGLRRANGYVWVVSGTELYRADENTAVATLIGTIAGSGAVRMIHNATHVVICSNVETYVATTTTLAVLSSYVFNGAAYQDGYGIFTRVDTEEMYISGLDDLTTIDALDFTTADAFPDNVVTCVGKQRQVWAFGHQTIEIYDNTGNASFPFERTGGGFLERGCLAPGSALKVLNYVVWLGDDRRVYRAAGYQEEPISAEGIETVIQATSSPSTAEAFTYTQNGSTFYALLFSDLTVIYDFTTGLWHERATTDLDRWRVSGHCSIPGAELVGDYEDGNIYTLDLDTYSENEEPIQRTVILPPLANGVEPIFVHELEVEAETGVGLASGDGSDPTLLLSWSDDDGNTWSNDVEASLGALGDRRTRVSYTRLGRSYNRSFRLRTSDPVKIAILGVRARIEAGAR